ncbi:MAG: UDP-N-acetylmuramoyl-L-alanine--D-glutamate ligase [Clostridia bacterium]|nr:UDP-N-acetylmuramoyl-L-alanine--D-glutamate ligase [Clostridia bacterium]
MENEKLKEFLNYIRNKKVAIIGLGVSNVPLLDYFYKQGCKITAFDNREIDNIDKNILDIITQRNIEFSFGKNNLSKLHGFDIIFRSPTCRADTPELVEEAKRGAIITSEIEMLIELCPGKVVGITGSDGKTTTTSLIYEILKKQGYNCYLGGNIGIPLFTKLEEMKKDDIVVLELSSFQLMDIKVSPQIAVITNISPNHLDIHKSYEEYIEAKKNIFKFQDENGILILNYDNEITKACEAEAPGKVVFFSTETKIPNGVILDDNVIKICNNNLRKHILNAKELLLRGKHNYANACTAIAATMSLADTEIQAEAIKNFKGVKHRLEFVREIDGVKWYNDSIGTSPTRTIAGLNSFEEKIVLIAGGYDKHLDYTPIAKPILDNVSSLILMGQTAGKIKKSVEDEMENSDKSIDIYECDTLKETIEVAKNVAKKGEVVLFSPASASFDMYKNFEERGDKFKAIVNSL